MKEKPRPLRNFFFIFQSFPIFDIDENFLMDVKENNGFV